MTLKVLEHHLDLYARYWTGPDKPHYSRENRVLSRFSETIRLLGKGFLERTAVPGHLTASAFITDPDFKKILLCKHKKLGKWLQLGGHADGVEDPLSVALKEAQEESGLSSIAAVSYGEKESLELIPIDLDIHLIPNYQSVPEHFHFDVRYLLVANPSENLHMSEESQDLRWFTWDQAAHFNSELSMCRVYERILQIKNTSLTASSLTLHSSYGQTAPVSGPIPL